MSDHALSIPGSSPGTIPDFTRIAFDATGSTAGTTAGNDRAAWEEALAAGGATVPGTGAASAMSGPPGVLRSGDRPTVPRPGA